MEGAVLITPKRVLLETVKTKYKMQHCDCISSGFTLFVKVKYLRQKNTIFVLKHYNLTPLDMYKGLSQAYCIKQEGRIHPL